MSVARGRALPVSGVGSSLTGETEGETEGRHRVCGHQECPAPAE